MQFEKVHPLDPQENIPAASAEESNAHPYIPQLQDQKTALANLDKFIAGDMTKTSNIKCLQDILEESQSNTPISSDSCNSDFVEEDDFEVTLKRRKHVTREFVLN